MLEKEINSMRYSTPIRFLKYLQYHWVASNSKGHGVHSPFVYQFIRQSLNGTSSFNEIVNSTPAVQNTLHAIEAANSSKLKPKIKLLIARLLQSLNPLTVSVTGDKKQFESDSSMNTKGTNESVESINFAFIGAGQDAATMLHNANKLIDKMHPNAWMILHQIHADADMETAWNTLKKHSNIRLSIDLFTIGILFCRTAQKEQEHFIIRY
jgi:hypothetical protein